ncbi:histidine kinase [Chitinophaga pendula]|uniref:sensor histidine kinase n=1 Tax=Chitinophaga TaxID=79328 RepID=UPI0018DF216C|nr:MULTISPECIES: histidine kinase [Chitinophaga]UCJ05075.1 histidine kinase [Chitinophaga pendula]
MDFQKSERLFSSKLFRYLSRILVLYVFSTIFKSFDLSFQELHVFNMRGHLFSLFYVLFGLLVWEGAIWVSRKTERAVERKHSTARLWYICGVLLLYGLCAALLFGFLYGLLDVLVFNRYEAWESFKAFSYDLNFGTFLFYLLILTFNGVVFYYKGWKEYQLQTERLMRENIQAKYDALRNQIDPHFFFNSLSVLTNIVYKSPDLAADYITQLAKTYRYILDKKFENLVPIQTELDFLDSYLFLIRIRHQHSIQFISEIMEKVKHKGMIPPATLQLLVENAIKHNRFSVNDPLIITVRSDEHSLTVTNHIRPKLHPDHSWGIGLENIHKRYELASGQGILVSQEGALFIVKIPIIFQS